MKNDLINRLIKALKDKEQIKDLYWHDFDNMILFECFDSNNNHIRYHYDKKKDVLFFMKQDLNNNKIIEYREIQY
jgi:hypothetical protein